MLDESVLIFAASYSQHVPVQAGASDPSHVSLTSLTQPGGSPQGLPPPKKLCKSGVIGGVWIWGFDVS